QRARRFLRRGIATDELLQTSDEVRCHREQHRRRIWGLLVALGQLLRLGCGWLWGKALGGGLYDDRALFLQGLDFDGVERKLLAQRLDLFHQREVSMLQPNMLGSEFQ